MRPEHVAVSIIIFVVVLLAVVLFLGKAIPIFSSGINSILEILKLK